MTVEREINIRLERLRSDLAPHAGATLAELRRRSKAFVDAVRAEGLGRLLEDEAIGTFLAAHGGALVDAAGPPWTKADLAAVELALGGSLAPSVRRCLEEGGLLTFRRGPSQAVRTFDRDEMLAALARVRKAFPPEGEPPMDDLLDSNAIYEIVVKGQVDLLPLSAHGADFMDVAVSGIRDDREENPIVMIDLVNRASNWLHKDAATWRQLNVRLSHMEIGS
jgi:hypothetical protein